MKSSKVALAKSKIIEKIEKIFGVLIAVTYLFVSVMLISGGDIIDSLLCLLFVLLGVLLFLAGRKRGKMQLEFKKYVALLSENPSGSLDNLAARTNTSVDIVRKNLQYMIKKHFFTSAYIDEKENRLVLQSTKKEVDQSDVTQGNSAMQNDEYEVRTCPCCGGKNKVKKGSVGECDFCGMPLS